MGVPEEHTSDLMIDRIPGMTAVLDRHGRIRHASRAVLDYTGETIEGLEHWPSNGIVHPDDVPAAVGRLAAAVGEGTSYEAEQRLRRFDGVYRWCRASVAPFRGGDGDITSWYVLVTDVDDLKRAEQASREGERKLRQIIDAIPAVAWSALPDGRADYFNQQYLDYLGVSLDQASEHGWTAAVHPDDVVALAESWARILASGAPGEAEARLRRCDGRYRWFVFRASPMRDADGRVIKWYGVNTDIDARKRAERALRHSEQLRAEGRLVETIPAMIWRGDASGDLDYLNQRAVDYLGHSARDLSGGRWLDIVHPDDRDVVARRRRAAVDAASSYDDVYRLRRADGQYRWIRVVGEVFGESGGRSGRWYGLLIDIDEQRRAEDRLRESEHHRRSIVDAIPALVCTFDAAGVLEHVNRQGLQYLGHSLEELRNQPLLGPLPGLGDGDRSAAAGTWLHSIETGEPYEAEHLVRGADGRPRWFQVRAHPLRDASGRVIRWHALLVDIETRKQADDELRRARGTLMRASQVATIAEMSASIAHEINQPLAAVVTNGQACQAWLTNEPPNVGRALATLDRIVRDGHSAAEVVHRIRALFNRSSPAQERLEVPDVIDEVLRSIALELRNEAIAVHTDLQAGLPIVSGDRVQIQQVLINLVHNAIESMRDVRERTKLVSIRARADRGGMLLEVSDRGCGLTDPAAVFDAFYTTKASGMGMGLAISRSIVESHGGRLWASANADVGSTFSFTLPVPA